MNDTQELAPLGHTKKKIVSTETWNRNEPGNPRKRQKARVWSEVNEQGKCA